GLEEAGGNEEAPQAHIGYYLVGPGQREFKARLDYRPRPGERLLEGALAHPHAVYFGGLVFCTGLVLGLLALLIRAVAGPGGAGQTGSLCSTGGGCGTRPRAAGWAGSASAAS